MAAQNPEQGTTQEFFAFLDGLPAADAPTGGSVDTPPQVAAREAKIRLVGAILADAGYRALYDSMTVEQAERLHDAMVARVTVPVTRMIVMWCETMGRDAPPGGVRYTEGWNGSLECLANRITREFGL